MLMIRLKSANTTIPPYKSTSGSSLEYGVQYSGHHFPEKLLQKLEKSQKSGLDQPRVWV